MSLALDLDRFNPHFTFHSPIHFDELDPMQMLHNARFASHIERAVSAFYLSHGGRWRLDVRDNPDQFHVVRAFNIEFLSPFHGTGDMRIDIWVERLGTTSCTYGFLCSSLDGSSAFARGERTIVKLDSGTHKPSPGRTPSARSTSFF